MKGSWLRHLAMPVVPTSIFLLAVGVWAAWRVQRLQERISHEVRENVSAMRSAEEVEILVRELGRRLERYRISGDRRHVDDLGGLTQEMDRWIAEAERWSFTPRELELSAHARQGWLSVRCEMQRITEQPALLTPAEYNRLEHVLTLDILTPTHEFLDLNEGEVEQSVTENQAAADGLVFGLLVLGTCGAGAGLAGGFWLARRWLQRLERSERAALHAEQLAALGHLAAGMAHELHNPITSIKMLVQAALTGNGFGGSEEMHSYAEPVLSGRDLTVLDEEVTRLEGLIRSFLDFARPPRPERRMVDVTALLQQALEPIAVRAAAAGVNIGFERTLPAIRHEVDPGQFRQVVLNLVLNALDAVKRGGRIDVALGRERDGDLVLQVADNGCGLPAELGPQIFDPFITSKPMGLGLGLSICKRIVEAHGGTIAGVTRPGGGAEFVVRLPVLGATAPLGDVLPV
jgi:signal transduction histidine kinase